MLKSFTSELLRISQEDNRERTVTIQTDLIWSHMLLLRVFSERPNDVSNIASIGLK